MSVIEEALRKAQQGLQPGPDASAALPSEMAEPAADAPEAASSRSISNRALLGGAVVGVIVWIAWGYLTPPAVSTPAVAEPAPRPLLHRTVAPSLTLSGVIGGAGEPLAIINGNVLQVGETIEGATLVSVQADSVTLRWRDQDLTLWTNP